jgi:hypothetical protein
MPDIEKHSATWSAIGTWARKELDIACIELEQTGLAPSSTENLRGRIGALRDLLRLADEAKPVSQSDGVDYGVATRVGD